MGRGDDRRCGRWGRSNGRVVNVYIHILCLKRGIFLARGLTKIDVACFLCMFCDIFFASELRITDVTDYLVLPCVEGISMLFHLFCNLQRSGKYKLAEIVIIFVEDSTSTGEFN